MSTAVLKVPGAAPLGEKRLGSEEAPATESPNAKRPRLGPDPLPGFVPCLQAPARGTEGHDTSVLQIGPYVLLEPRDGGRSYRAAHRPTGAEYSCKVYPMRSYQEAMAPYGRLPPHPSVARVAEVIQGDRSAYVFFPPSHGDMHSHVQRRKRLPEAEAAALFRQMAEAVAHCHQHGVVLRDLKLRKFVFADRERTRLVLESLEDAHVLSGPDDALSDKHGCPAYVGPEILRARPRYSGKAADVWSLGVALYTMLVGRYPFQEAEPTLLFSKIRRGAFSVPGGLSARARCLVRCLLRRTPAERLSTPAILLHPWLAGAGGTIPEPCSGPCGRRGLDQVVPDVWGRRDEEEQEEDLYS
ncbi:PREDICTED: tribbles homolog 3 [Gavialis gangeticus]|uniref:tribbles homolog 3 n=1 Tax=Gavialis gangeticus TaxID=94835 RepID=UPI00092F67F8|nr:PREDICTED: tribbles homolog 3 [Gavialis gangeticus]